MDLFSNDEESTPANKQNKTTKEKQVEFFLSRGSFNQAFLTKPVT